MFHHNATVNKNDAYPPPTPSSNWMNFVASRQEEEEKEEKNNWTMTTNTSKDMRVTWLKWLWRTKCFVCKHFCLCTHFSDSGHFFLSLSLLCCCCCHELLLTQCIPWIRNFAYTYIFIIITIIWAHLKFFLRQLELYTNGRYKFLTLSYF